jgi:hypothetical protein
MKCGGSSHGGFNEGIAAMYACRKPETRRPGGVRASGTPSRRRDAGVGEVEDVPSPEADERVVCVGEGRGPVTELRVGDVADQERVQSLHRYGRWIAARISSAASSPTSSGTRTDP